MRIFIGIELPQEIEEYLELIQQKVKTECVSGNFTRKENFHLTLRFIGETEVGQIKALKQALDNAVSNFRSFNLSLSQLGQFRRGNKHIIWVGLKPESALDSLHSSIETALVAIGYPKESRGFSPHITLGREVVFMKDFNSFGQHVRICSKTVPVNRIILFESTRINGVLTYKPLYAKDLQNSEI